MVVKGMVKPGAYFDSVTLMQAARELSGRPGVSDAAVVMATAENKAILKSSGMLLPEFNAAGDADLLIAVQAADEKAAALALAEAEPLLRGSRKRTGQDAAFSPKSLESALQVLQDANLAVISVAGRYAGEVAMDALQKGLHVMIFSDNIPLETEIELKKFAQGRGLLVMGPDCGTAIINGVPLGLRQRCQPRRNRHSGRGGHGPAGGLFHHLQRRRRGVPGHRHRRPGCEKRGRRHHVPGRPAGLGRR